jgi:hypothetical protein
LRKPLAIVVSAPPVPTVLISPPVVDPHVAYAPRDVINWPPADRASPCVHRPPLA